MRGRKKSTIFHHAVAIFFLLNCVMTVSSERTSFGTLGTIQFEAGDTILIPCIPVLGRFTFPYHAFFAVSKEHLFHVQASQWNKTRPLIIKRGDFNDEQKLTKAKVVRPDLSSKRKLLDLNAIAIPLAYRMSNTDLPYNLFNCNCRHYCDFLTYGKTYGTWNPGYLSMSKRCPLAEAIEVRAGKFVLKDKNNRTYTLNGPKWTGTKKDHVLKVEHREHTSLPVGEVRHDPESVLKRTKHPEHTSTADKVRHDPDSVLKVKEHHENTSTAGKVRHDPDSVLKVKEHHEHTSTADKLRHDPESVLKGKGKVRGRQTLQALFKEPL